MLDVVWSFPQVHYLVARTLFYQPGYQHLPHLDFNFCESLPCGTAFFSSSAILLSTRFCMDFEVLITDKAGNSFSLDDEDVLQELTQSLFLTLICCCSNSSYLT